MFLKTRFLTLVTALKAGLFCGINHSEKRNSMPLKTWVTKSRKPFSCFYYYNTMSRNFVRIRLELGRKGLYPNPGISARLNRFIGFVDDISAFDFEDFNRWTVNHKNEIVYCTGNDFITLSKEPAEGKRAIDFSLAIDELHPTFIHLGNTVAKAPGMLPVNSKGKEITDEMLVAIAESQLGEYTSISLCTPAADECELADAIFKLYRHINFILQN